MIGPDAGEGYEALLATALRDVRTACTGTVQSYDPATQTADVLPDVQEEVMIDGVPTPITSAAIPGVPVVFPGSALRGLTYGLDEGDRLLLLWRHRSHDEVDSGTEALPINPASSRRLNPLDVVALPFAVPGAKTAAQRRADGQPVIYLDAGDALHAGAATAALKLSRDDRVQAQLAEISAQFTAVTLTLTTWSTALGTALGAPPYVAPPDTYSPGATDTTRVMVDE